MNTFILIFCVVCFIGFMLIFFGFVFDLGDLIGLGFTLIIITTIVIAVFSLIEKTKVHQESIKQETIVQNLKDDGKYYEMIYSGFIKKFKLSSENQFRRIKGETKSQLVKRIRIYLETIEIKTDEDIIPKKIEKENKIQRQFKKELKFENNW